MANYNGNDPVSGLGILALYHIDGPVHAPTFTESPLIYVDDPYFVAWEDFPPGNGNFAQQLGRTNRIHLSDSRMQNLVFRRGTLWATHHIFVQTNAPTAAIVQWYEITPGGFINQLGQLGDVG